MSEKPSCLLPENIQPLAYEVWLKPNLDNFTFEGNWWMRFRVIEPTNRIILHAADLDIHYPGITVGLDKNNIKSLVAVDVSFDKDRQTVTFVFGETLNPGEAILGARIFGKLNDQLCGFYRSKYRLSSGEERFMATTQCEAIDARRIFPCIDEPARKAVFKISVSVPQNLTAISNMPVMMSSTQIATPNSPSLKTFYFKESPKMSTYLFALMVGEFEWVEGRTKDGILVRVVTTPGKRGFGNFPLAEGTKLLDFYTRYFSAVYPLSYPLSKMDLLAIPDFAAGAMENWGAIAFRETDLLIDPNNSSEAAIERVFDVVSHENAHMWFGDLVTMKWWDGLWLNEAFATFMELVACKSLHPEWKPEDKFVAENIVMALGADGLRSSQPIHAVINQESEIDEAFGPIAYEKGSAVLRMLEKFLGPEVFRRGLSLYLHKHAYGNTDPEDLWDAFEVESGKSVRSMMDSWIKQTGYPVIHVKRKKAKDGFLLELSQERFLYEREGAKDSSWWSIPLVITTREISRDSSKEIYLFLEHKDLEVDIPSKPSFLRKNNWIKLNTGHTGFFRVHYEPNELLKFKKAVSSKELSVADRIGLCDDAHAFTKAGYYSADLLLDFLTAYKDENEFRVWQVLAGKLGFIGSLVYKESCAGAFKFYVQKLTKSVIEKLGWDEQPEENHDTKILRGLALGMAGRAGREDIIQEAKKRFEAYLKNPDSLSPNLRGVVYGIAASCGDENVYNTLLDLYRKQTLPEEKMRFLKALTDFSDPALIDRTLEFLVSGEVRSQDVFLALRGLALNPVGRGLTWKFVAKNWDTFYKMYGEGRIRRVIEAVCGLFVSFDDEKEIRSFFEEHLVPTAEKTIEQSLESIRINARWLERDREAFKNWFEENKM